LEIIVVKKEAQTHLLTNRGLRSRLLSVAFYNMTKSLGLLHNVIKHCIGKI